MKSQLIVLSIIFKCALAFLLLCSAGSALGQITVAGSGGFSNGTYPTLKSAFDAINAVGTQSGNTITISITASISDNNSAVLNQPSLSSWISLTISPVGGSWTLSGSVNGPLIDFNGSDNVTINGMNSGGNGLTISNTSTSNTPGTSTIRLINDASNNTMTNCTILGSSITNPAQSFDNTIPTAATILIANTNGTTGNDNNTISQNTISEAGSNLPTVAICSAGQSTTISNDLCVITGNRIANFFNINGANGIAIASNSSAFTITSNKFYQSSARTGMGSIFILECIFINTSSGGGYQVNNNTIGYASHDGTGMLTSNNGRFAGIDFTSVAATPISEIQGNTINGINWTSTYNTVNVYSNAVFHPVIVRAGGVNIGTTTGNTIGALTGTGSPTSNLYLQSTGSFLSASMIYVNSSTACTIANNHIGAVTLASGLSYINGIVVEGSGAHSILSNEIGNATVDNFAFNSGNTGLFKGIYCNATGNETIGANGQGNTIQNIVFLESASHSFEGIVNNNNPGTLNINYNTIKGIVFAGPGSSNPTFTGIINAGIPVTSVNMNNNHLGTNDTGLVSFLTSGNSNGNFTCISCGSLSTAATLSISNNDIRGITHNGTSGSGQFYIRWNHSGSVTDNINNNTFTNLNIKAGAVIFMERNGNMATGAVENINGNAIVGGFTKTSGNGQIFFLSTSGTSASGTTSNNLSNDFSNITILDQSSVFGWKNSIGVSGSFGPQKNISGNTFNNLTGNATTTVNYMLRIEGCGTGSVISGNTIQNISCGTQIYGISCDQNSSFASSMDISLNKVGNLNIPGSGVIIGMHIKTNNSTISKNKIFDLSSGGTGSQVRGVQMESPYLSGITQTLSNNYIGNLNTPLSTNANAVMGIYFNSFSTSTTNAYYNTIYLASTGGSGFGSSGIFHSTNTNSTSGQLNLRNNIILNLSTPGAGGLSVAFRRSGGNANELNNYAASSNNNLFYAGTPSASRLIYYDVVSSAATITAYRNGVFTAGTIAPRETQSISEVITPANFFLSTTGTDAGFLHINPSNPTLIEGGAAMVATITDDYDGDTRNNSTPDIGADEGTFTLNTSDLSGPEINYTPILNGIVQTTKSFTGVIITDLSNVEGSAGIRPRVYYKRSTDTNVFNDNTNSTSGWKYVEANTSTSPFDFTLNFTLLSGGTGLAAGNTIQYFVIAQDQATTPNVGIKSGSFPLDPVSVALTSGAFPVSGAINSFPILQSISGTITVPGTYPSLTGAGGAFATINANIVTGNINIEITSNLGVENGLNALNEYAAPYTIKIYPTGVARFLSGNANSGGIIKLNGADRVTIDGSIGGTGTDRSMSFTNTSTTFPSVIVINSLGAGTGANQNTIKNCNINISNQNHSSYGISLGGSTPGTSGADNDDNTIQNNNFTIVSTPIYANGTTSVSGGGNDNLQIINNSIASNTSAPECFGIRVGNSLNSLVKSNSIDLISTNTVYPVGISIETGCLSSQITSNLITGVRAIGFPYGARGISIGTGSVNSDLTIANNVIYNVNGQDNADITKSSMGISIGLLGNTQTSSTTGGIKLYFNSVNMFNTLGNGSTITTALYTGLAAGNLDIRNNIFGNTNSGSNSTIKNYSLYSAAPNTAFTTLNLNDYYSNNPNSPVTAIPGYIGSDRLDLAAIQSGFGQNANSIITNPSFFSNTDLRPTSGNVLGVANTTGTGITVDYLNVPRSTNAPPNGSTMGAYENGFDNSAPIIQYTSLQSSCSTDDRTLSVTITDISGVPVTGTFMPRIYFKKNAGAYFSSPGILSYGTGMNGSWTFTISAISLGGITPGDVISYFVIAQDNSVPIKISSNPSTGLVATNVNIVATPPTTPNSYSISYTLSSGIYSVGTATTAGEIGHFPTLTSAIQAYNNACLTGAPIFVLTDNTYGNNETFPITINQNSLASNANILTIKPAQGTTPVITGSAATSLIDIVGGDYILIDGSNNGTTTKNLTFSNTNTSGSVIRFSNDATHNSVNNCILKGVSTSTSTGVVYFASTTLTNGNDFNLIQNNDITAGNTTNANGIYNSGNSTTTISKNSDIQIIGNNIYNFSTAGILDNGGSVGTKYLNNQIYEVINQPSSQIFGFTCTSNTIEGFTFQRNRVFDLKSSVNTTVTGINILNIAPGPIGEITNNMVALNTANVINSYAIADYTGTGTVLKIDFNSFSISGSGFGFSAVYYRVANSTIELKDNIISNTKVNGGPNYTIYVQGNTNNISSDYNNLYILPSGNLGLFGNTTLYNFASWKSFTNQDQHSLSVLNVFQSPTDLHLVVNGNCNFENAGIAIPGLNTDFDNQIRNSSPDIGADEFTGIPLSACPAGPDQILCASNAQMAATEGPAGSIGTWSPISGIGSFSSINSATASVSGLWNGLNTFKWTVVNGSCSTVDTVSITNNSPNIWCYSGNLFGIAQPGSCTAILDYFTDHTGSPEPNITYEFSGATTASGNGNGSQTPFNIGVTNVTVRASNGCGTDATCGFQVEVYNTEITVTGNNVSIPDAQTVPALSNQTNFDTIIINTSLTRTFTISNTSSLFMTLGNVTITGPDASLYTVTQPLLTTLYGGEATTFTVTLTPTGIGWKTATIHISNSDCDNADFDFTVKGYGGIRYHFIGSGNWTNVNKWYPSYPGLTLQAGLEAHADYDGQLTIPSDIKVNINGDLYIPYASEMYGDITIGSQGSITCPFMTVEDTLFVQAGGKFNARYGALYIANYPTGALLNHGIVNLDTVELLNESVVNNFPEAILISNYVTNNLGIFENHGTFIANGTLAGLIQNMPDGKMKIAEPYQCLYNFDQLTTQGTLEINIDGTSDDCNHFDKINGIGWLELSGTLKLNINYTPANNDAITILESGALSGQFTSLDAPPGWTIYYNYPTTNKVTIKYNCNTTSITSQPLFTQKVCQDAIPSTIAVSASGTGLQYQWYKDTWYEGYNGIAIAGAVSATYIPPTPVPGTYFFYAKVTGACGQVYSQYSEMNVDARGTWVGATSSDWHTSSNWCGGVPDMTTNIFISPRPFNPIVSTANATCRRISIFPPATLEVKAPRELRVKG